MKDFNIKVDNVTTEEGFLFADDVNSITSELRNAVGPFMDLSENDDTQLGKVIDLVSKSMYYTDTGTANALMLNRRGMDSGTEVLKDGIVIVFKPSTINNGPFTIKVSDLPMKTVLIGGLVPTANYLSTSELYAAVYDSVTDVFNVWQLSFNSNLYVSKSSLENGSVLPQLDFGVLT